MTDKEAIKLVERYQMHLELLTPENGNKHTEAINRLIEIAKKHIGE